MLYGLRKWFKSTFLGFEEKTVRSRNDKGQYRADDKSTPNINEAYKTVQVKRKSKKSKRKKRSNNVKKS